MSPASRLLSALLRHLLQLGVLGLLLLALYVSLGRQLAPLVAEYRVDVELRAEKMLGMPVSIGRLEGGWNYLWPQLTIRDLEVGEGAEAIALDRLQVELDVFRSLWRRQPLLRSVDVGALRLMLSEDAEGRWRLVGLPKREGPPPEVEQILAALQGLPYIAVYDAQVTVRAHGEAPRTLNYVDLALASGAGRMRLDARAVLPDGQPLAVNVQARVRPQHWREAALDAYLSLPQSRWSEWLPKRLTGLWRVDELKAGGEFWLRWRDGAPESAVVRLSAAELNLARGEGKPASLTALGLTAYLHRRGDGYRLLLDNLAFDQGGERWEEARIGLDLSQDAEGQPGYEGWATRLEVGPLVPLVLSLAPLPEKAASVLADLAPYGTLRNLSFAFRPAAPPESRLRYAANLENAGFSARHWIPAAGNITGTIEGSFTGGELRFDAEQPSLHLAQLFPEPWHYRQARGRLGWTIDSEAVTLVAPYIQVDGEEGRIAGDFLIRLRIDPAEEDYMDLRVGMRDGDARFAERYLPSRLPAMNPALTTWLSEAIRGGNVEEGYFLYQGSLNAGAPKESRNLSLYFRVNDAELNYREGWPSLREGVGEVLVENGDTRVRLSGGRVLDTRISSGTAHVFPPKGKQPVRVTAEATARGPLADGLSILRDTPLGLDSVFGGWQVDGEADSRIALDIPIQAGSRPLVLVDFATRGAKLNMPSPALNLTGVAGDFRYDSRQGLSAKGLKAQVLGREVKGRAVAIGTPTRPATRIEADGSVALETLTRWLAFTPKIPAQGSIPYRLRLTIDGADSRLQADSSLVGLALELPAPFGKSAETARDASFEMTLQGVERRYWARYADLAALTFAAPPANWVDGRGELRIGGGDLSLPVKPGLRVMGQLESLDFNAWRQVVSNYLGTGGEVPAANEGAAGLLRLAQLKVGKLEGFGVPIESVALKARRAGSGWKIDLDSQQVAGQIVQASGAPLDIHLTRLRLPAAPPAPAEPVPTWDAPDPLAGVDPAGLPPMNIAIDSLWRGADDFGTASFTLRPRGKGVQIGALALRLKGLNIGGSISWEPEETRYIGRIEGGNVADVLVAWGFAPSATSERFTLDVNGSWPGSPARFAFERLSGRLEPELLNGQFVEVEGGAQALRVFGLLNFHSIGRRLRLDFSDLLGRGLSYDEVDGVLVADNGAYVTLRPLKLNGPSASLELDGTLDLASQRIDAKLLVTLPVTNNLPLAAILAGAPAVAGALWVADRLLGDQIARFATVQYKVEGPWQAPKISFDKPFEKPD